MIHLVHGYCVCSTIGMICMIYSTYNIPGYHVIPYLVNGYNVLTQVRSVWYRILLVLPEYHVILYLVPGYHLILLLGSLC